MTSKHLSNNEFLTRLTTLLSTTHSKTHGSVFLTQKSLPIPEKEQILIRASTGKPPTKAKLSTLVDTSELADFYGRYAEVCKKGMEGLRKRERKKKKAGKKAKKGAASAGKTG